jgi:RND family efflux transporter MFP subunit
VTLDARDLTAARSSAVATARATSEGQTAASAERQSAEAAAVLARATHARISALRTKNSATPQELDQATSALQSAEARVRSADARVAEAEAAVDAARAAGEAATVTASFAILTAPFDGVITAKLVEAGNMASPGVPLLTLEDTTAFRLEVRVDETRAALIQPGARVAVELDDNPQSTAPAVLTGSVAEVARSLDADAHAFLVKIDLPAGAPVRSGMFGRARFAEGRREGLAVPAGSLVRRGQLTIVFVVDREGRARMRPIRVGARSDDRIEVLAGLDAGERIIIAPPSSLADGMLVREGARR